MVWCYVGAHTETGEEEGLFNTKNTTNAWSVFETEFIYMWVLCRTEEQKSKEKKPIITTQQIPNFFNGNRKNIPNMSQIRHLCEFKQNKKPLDFRIGSYFKKRLHFTSFFTWKKVIKNVRLLQPKTSEYPKSIKCFIF